MLQAPGPVVSVEPKEPITNPIKEPLATTHVSSADARAVLPRELSLFLVQLSITLSKTRTYPPGHPALAGAVTAVIQRLRSVLQDRPGLTIGIARHQLLIEGRPTDASNPVLRELALRLHRHQLAAVHLSAGIEPEEFADLLARLGEETWRQGHPLGLEPRAQLDRWPHVTLEPLNLEQLELDADRDADDRDGGVGANLWLSLAATAMPDSKAGQAGATDPEPEPREIAHAIVRRRGDPAYDKIIADYMVQMGEGLTAGTTGEVARVRQRLAGLVEAIDPERLQQLLSTGSDLAEQRKLLMQAASSLPVEAVLKLLEAAATASNQNISHAFLRMLHKLAAHTEVEAAQEDLGAEAALRDAARQLVTGWSLEDPHPVSYRRLLELLARSRPDQDPAAGEYAGSEASRMVEMCLELGADVEPGRRAADEMIERGQLLQLLELLDRCGTEPVAEALWNSVASPAVVKRLLLQEAPDFRAIERLLDRMGLAGAEPMLDTLEVAEHLTLRRRLVSRLGGMGPELAPLIGGRLVGKPWYVQRNLLLLLGTVGEWPPDFSPEPYASHPDPRVRREAYKLMLKRPETAADAITAALADDDAGIVRLGLTAALDGCPTAALPHLFAGLEGRYKDPEVRLLAIRVLGRQQAPEARDWLLGRAGTRSRWLGRWRLEPKSPELLAALSALAGGWAGDPQAAAVLRRATASFDREIRDAARVSAP